MPSQNDRQASLAEVIRTGINAALLELRTALPGTIESYDEATQLASVRLGIRRQYETEDGSIESVEIPKLVDVPVVFPRAGGFALTFPVAAGDGCLVVFCERDIGGWMETGRVQDPVTRRRHDYSDAVAFVGLSAKPNALSSAATDAVELRSADGATRIALDDTGTITVESDAAGGISIEAGTGGVTIDGGSGGVAITGPGSITLTRGADELVDLCSQLVAVLEALTVNTTTGAVQPATVALLVALRARFDAIKA